jgi:hypothetical protein
MNYNCNFVAHVIRDVFPNQSFVSIYGDDLCLQTELRSSEHGIGAFLLHTEESLILDNEECKYWDIGINNPFLSYRSVSLMISLNYKLELTDSRAFSSAIQLSNLIIKRGNFMVVNPGSWASSLPLVFNRNSFLEEEIKRFSIFKNEEVAVYENI